MNARVGATSARGFHLTTEQQFKCMFYLALYRELAGLSSKTAKECTVVGDGERKRHIVFDIIHIEHDTSFMRERTRAIRRRISYRATTTHSKPGVQESSTRGEPGGTQSTDLRQTREGNPQQAMGNPQRSKPRLIAE